MIDHLVYGTADLDETVAELGDRLGMGTRNSLASLGSGAYLEVIGPDPAQPRPFGVDDLTEPRLLTWVARVSGIDRVTAKLSALGLELPVPSGQPGLLTVLTAPRGEVVLT